MDQQSRQPDRSSGRIEEKKTMRAIAASWDVAQKHKYALAFWMFAVFAISMTLFAPPV